MDIFSKFGNVNAIAQAGSAGHRNVKHSNGKLLVYNQSTLLGHTCVPAYRIRYWAL